MRAYKHRNLILAPLLAVATGAGCIPIPIPTRLPHGYNLEENVGRSSSDCPIIVGETTYRRFVHLAGEPSIQSPDHRYAIYQWNTMGVTWFWLFLGIPLPAFQDWDGSRWGVWLVRFDERGMFVSFKDLTASQAGDIYWDEWGWLPADALAALKNPQAIGAARERERRRAY